MYKFIKHTVNHIWSKNLKLSSMYVKGHGVGNNDITIFKKPRVKGHNVVSSSLSLLYLGNMPPW